MELAARPRAPAPTKRHLDRRRATPHPMFLADISLAPEVAHRAPRRINHRSSQISTGRFRVGRSHV
eukprot:380348-Pyramimonas_sp.AAC.1